MRRAFDLREEDEAFLQRRHGAWEAIQDGGGLWVLIHDFLIPDGFAQNAASLAIQISPGYPDTQLDMAYFYPDLARSDGKAIRQLSSHNIDGKTWQRWSRHRTTTNPWRPGYDNLETHILMVEGFLTKELSK